MLNKNNKKSIDLVSIIIPNFNREHLIGETLDSILNQSYPNWECIVVDDHSTDKSEKVIRKYCDKDERIKYFSRPENKPKGQCSCRNFGYEMSKGMYVNWFDSDDIMEKEFISSKVNELMSNPDVDAVISKSKYFDHKSGKELFSENRTELTNNLFEDFLVYKISWYLPDPMWRRDFLKDQKLFNEELIAGGVDREFHARMLLYKPSIVIIDKFLTQCRKHEQNTSSHFYNSTQKNNLMKIKHLHSTKALFDLFQEHQVITKTIKETYFKSSMKYLPYVYNNSDAFSMLIELMKDLSINDIKTKIYWIKFWISYFSFSLTGRGNIFLK